MQFSANEINIEYSIETVFQVKKYRTCLLINRYIWRTLATFVNVGNWNALLHFIILCQGTWDPIGENDWSDSTYISIYLVDLFWWNIFAIVRCDSICQSLAKFGGMQTVFIEVGANIFRRDLAGINGSETLMPLGKERLFWFFEKGEVTKKGSKRNFANKNL